MTDFAEAMDAIAAHFKEGRLVESLACARELKGELLAESKPDPQQLGWARFYELKSLHGLGQFRELCEVKNRPEPKIYALSTKNAAYLASLATEAAAELGLAEEVVRFSRECLEERAVIAAHADRASAANNAVIFLTRLGRADLAEEFQAILNAYAELRR